MHASRRRGKGPCLRSGSKANHEELVGHVRSSCRSVRSTPVADDPPGHRVTGGSSTILAAFGTGDGSRKAVRVRDRSGYLAHHKAEHFAASDLLKAGVVGWASAGWKSRPRYTWSRPVRTYLESTRSYLGKWVEVLVLCFYGVMPHFQRYFGGSRYVNVEVWDTKWVRGWKNRVQKQRGCLYVFLLKKCSFFVDPVGMIDLLNKRHERKPPGHLH